MSSPQTAVDLCNLALDHLGQASISDIESPQNTAEETCARWYDVVRKMLLREYVWNFAKKRTVLSRSGDGLFDFEDAYTLPNDYIRFLSIGGTREIDQEIDYDIEGQTILLNNGGANSVNFRYIADVTNPQEWDELFVNIFALSLALKISYKFTLKKGLVKDLSDLLALDLPKAVTIDGQERPPRRIQRSVYLARRRSGAISHVADGYTVID